MIDTGLQEI